MHLGKERKTVRAFLYLSCKYTVYYHSSYLEDSGSQGPNANHFYRTGLFWHDHNREVERQYKKRNKQRQCSKSAARVRPGIWLVGIIDEYSVKEVTFSFKADQTWATARVQALIFWSISLRGNLKLSVSTFTTLSYDLRSACVLYLNQGSYLHILCINTWHTSINTLLAPGFFWLSTFHLRSLICECHTLFFSFA